ncbi:hypothetical protein TrLO_g1567 [Triparma laevis f. longispina]|uniref:Uncharacterized protein n=1 Tax=Triparma laevis f. longispina TaxID=1714387 RepID=A0A9W6ZVS8_9STRA|nr:hypothetical protein TrLO_g1567 [Triparma laevis f. longispina]
MNAFIPSTPLKKSFKPRVTAGSIPKSSGKGLKSRPKPVSHLPKPSTKVFRKLQPVVKERAFKPYVVPKLKRSSTIIPQSTITSASASTSTSTSASTTPKTTPTLQNKAWNLRSYFGECMVITLTVSDPTNNPSVTIRTSELVDGFKIPPPNDGRVRDWTKTTSFDSSQAALAFAKSNVATAIDNDFTEGTCPSCSGPGKFTEVQLSEKEGQLRAGVLDGRGRDAICRKCDVERKRIDSLQHGS